MAFVNSLHVLTLNVGSSTLKFGLYRVQDESIEVLFSDIVHTANPHEVIQEVSVKLMDLKLPMPDAIGHRFVHGGFRLREHCLITNEILQQLEDAVEFAPLHNQKALAVIRATLEHFVGLPEAVCFDTAFHNDLPDVARTLPIAKALQGEGIQRYGFHGLSCESILRQLGDTRPPKLIIAHLGNGASVTAIKDGKSIDTSMGLTPSGGVMMGSRSGDIDPGVLIYLMREKHYGNAQIEGLIDHNSGMLGISGVTSDMRELHNIAKENADAELAIEMFCYSVRKQIAGMIAVLKGIDLLVFTGGIGEHDAALRASICLDLAYFGIDAECDYGSNVKVLTAQENEQIALHAQALLYIG
jgi:acetate kinase